MGSDDGDRSRRAWPADPDDLLAEGWSEISDPEAAKAGRRTFLQVKTGETAAFDKARPGQPGFEGKDHYHRINPHSTGRRDANLDADGNAVPRGSKRSHIIPGENE